MGIIWRDTMSVGIGEIDRDHKRLVAMANAMEKAVASSDETVVRAVMQELTRYVVDHFRREEGILARLGDTGLGRHKELHAAAADRLLALGRRYSIVTDAAERNGIAQQLHTFLNHWIINHILKEDMRIKAGRGAPPAAPDTVAVSVEPVSKPEAPRSADVEYSLPGHLAHLLKRIEYVAPSLPSPEGGFESFERLCEAAVCRRVDAVLVFFQRDNPDLVRELPPVFLASPEFATKLRRAIGAFIIPEILRSRQLRMLETRFDWRKADARSFWESVPPEVAADIMERWAAAWTGLRLVEKVGEDGGKVLQVRDTTRRLREMLQPDTPEAYDLPRICNPELDVFRSLFCIDPEVLVRLNRAWRKCHDLYEQEMDPRIFQQKARDGAFRDTLLEAFHGLPAHWGEFLVLTSYRVFARVTTHFLERFTTNLGRTADERHEHMPYLMRTLAHAHRIHAIRSRERLEEAQWQAQRQELGKILRGLGTTEREE